MRPRSSTKNRYRAFISYSQKDKRLARQLHRWLEAYKTPKGLSPYGTRKLGKFFRDDDDMPASSDIGKTLREAIEQSEALIVLCSPNSAKSKWVDAEIQHFRKSGKGDQVFAVIIDGKPNSNDPATECFPISFRPSSASQWGVMPVEPLGLHLREDGRERVLTRLAAALAGVDFDSLWQRERRRRSAQAVLSVSLFASAICLLAIALGAGWLAMDGLAQASRQSSNILARESRAVFETENGDHSVSLLMALQADPLAHRTRIRQAFDGKDGYEFARSRMLASHSQNYLAQRFLGHREAIQSIAISADGRQVATAALDGTVRIWDAQSGRSLFQLVATGPAISVAWSPVGTRIAIGTGGVSGGTAEVWDSTTGLRVLPPLAHESRVLSVSFSDDGRQLITGSSDEGARTWDLDAGIVSPVLAETEATISAVAVSPDHTLMAIASSSDTVEIRNVGSGQALKRLVGQDDTSSLAFSSDGNLLAAGSLDGTALVWDIERELVLASLEGHGSGITSVAFAPDDWELATGSWDGTVKVWDLFNYEPVKTLGTGTLAINSVAYSADGAFLATGNADGTGTLWNLWSDHLVSTEPAFPEANRFGFVSDALIAPNGRYAAIVEYDGVMLIDIETGTRLARFDPAVGEFMKSPAFSLDGERFAVGVANGRAKVWDIPSSKLIGTVSTSGAPSRSDSLGSNARTPIADAGEGEDEIYLPSGTVFSSVALSPDGSRLALDHGDGAVAIIEVETGKLVQNLSGETSTVTSLAFSPDGTLFAVGSSDGAIRIWNLVSESAPIVLAGHDTRIDHLVFSPDGRQLASGSHDKSVMMWDPFSGRLRATFRGHNGSIGTIAFSTDGRWLLTGSADGKSLLWDIRTGEILAIFEGHRGGVVSVGFKHDEKGIMTLTHHGLVQHWEIPEILLASPKDQVRIACQHLKRVNAKLNFSAIDAQIYPVLQGEPIDPLTGDFSSPCQGFLEEETLSRTIQPKGG